MKTLLKGKGTVEQRIILAETIINRLSRRSRKVIVGIVPPQPIFSCVAGEDVKGDILKAMLFRGKISKGIIVFNEKPKKTICIDISVLSNSIGETKTYYLDSMRNIVDLDIPTIDGSMITVSINSTSEEYKITEVWLSMLWISHVSNAEIERRLIEELEKASIENVSEE